MGGDGLAGGTGEDLVVYIAEWELGTTHRN